MSFVRFVNLCILALLAPLAASSTAVAQQTRVFVDLNSTNTAAPSSSNQGATWATAYKALTTGIVRANVLAQASGSFIEVWVRAGTYYPDEGHDANGNPLTAGDRSLTFSLHENVGLYGGFDATESGDPAGFRKRNPILNVTILDGDLDDDDTADWGDRGDNSLHVVTADSVGVTARLDGFVIRGGSAVGAYPDGTGGGILITAGSPSASARIVRCVFIDNQAEQVFAIKGTPR